MDTGRKKSEFPTNPQFQSDIFHGNAVRLQSGRERSAPDVREGRVGTGSEQHTVVFSDSSSAKGAWAAGEKGAESWSPSTSADAEAEGILWRILRQNGGHAAGCLESQR